MARAVVVPPRFMVPTNIRRDPVRAYLRGGVVTLLVAYVFLVPALCGWGSKNESRVIQLVKAEEGAALTSRDGKMTANIPSSPDDGSGKGDQRQMSLSG